MFLLHKLISVELENLVEQLQAEVGAVVKQESVCGGIMDGIVEYGPSS